MTRAHIIVEGRVQGVFFRSSAARKASELGLKGWVRNNPDGTVELVAEGDERSVNQVIAWCHSGPPRATVTAVKSTKEQPTRQFNSFSVR